MSRPCRDGCLSVYHAVGRDHPSRVHSAHMLGMQALG